MSGSICPCRSTVHDSSACPPMRTRLSNSTAMPCLVCGGNGHGAGQCVYLQNPQNESATLATLRAENERLREALKRLADASETVIGNDPDMPGTAAATRGRWVGALADARAALKGVG